MSAKEAKHRFRDSGQEYTEKRMQATMPVIFFETMEISWLPFKSIKEWADAISAGPHLKSRTVKRFRAGLVQLCDFMCSSKTPKNWVCKAPAPVVTAQSDSRRSAGTLDRQPRSPGRPAAQTAPLRQRPRSAPSVDTPQERLQTEQARAKEAILGGVSRDERHRRRLESLHCLDVGASLQAESSQQHSRHSEPRTAGRVSGGARKAPSQPAAPTDSASKAADASDGHHGALSAAESESFGRRHTRSKGQAELGATDLDNLALRKGGPLKRAGGHAPLSQDVKAPAESSTGPGGGGVDKPAASLEHRALQPEVASALPSHLASAAPAVDSSEGVQPSVEQATAAATTAGIRMPSTTADAAVLASDSAGDHGTAAKQPDPLKPGEDDSLAQSTSELNGVSAGLEDSGLALLRNADTVSEHAGPTAVAAAKPVVAPGNDIDLAADQAQLASSEGGEKVATGREPSHQESGGVCAAEADVSGGHTRESAGPAKVSKPVPGTGSIGMAVPGASRRSQRDVPGRKSALELMHGGVSRAKDSECKGHRRNSDPKTRQAPSALKCASSDTC
jgi:hypothetical protein